MMVELFAAGLKDEFSTEDPAKEPLRGVLYKLLALFALEFVEGALGELLEDGYMVGCAESVRSAIEDLLTEIRPDAVALVDAFNHTDYALNSAIGRYDGQVYPALWEHAQRSTDHLIRSGPGGVIDGFLESIAPSTRSRL
mmetsp:Transcript_31672/g.38254  ORF Transcript_31672/g.38254 Transcript_31672/m.38254 type:complete len:140 (+) Transcript_31672:71-490(+)